jgi:hypothetical protein
MAKKAQKLEPLTLQEIILRGDAATIRQALEARVQIDTLLDEREAAYRRIAELETQVSEIVGEDGVFPFPAPPLEVASYVQRPAPKKKVVATPAAVETPVAQPEVTTAAVLSATTDEATDGTTKAVTAPTSETTPDTDADAEADAKQADRDDD